MHTYDISHLPHDHVFNQDQARPGEQRTLIIVVMTAIFMVVEIVAGLYYGSMALLADGLHMTSHVAALGISVAAYVFARRYAADRRFSFGTGKVNSLAAFASAILLVGFATLMTFESIERLFNPVLISFDQAILIAVLGLFVNGVSAWLLASTPHHHHDHGLHYSEYSDGEAPASVPQKDDNQRAAHIDIPSEAQAPMPAIAAQWADKLRFLINGARAWLLASISHHHHHDDKHDHAHHTHQYAHGESATSELYKDHNLRAAYIHVLADALTSLLAIVALLAGKYVGAAWLDPVMGIVGAILVGHWSWGLLRISSKVLLDWQADDTVVYRLRGALLVDGRDRITDLHVWTIGQGQHAAEVSIVTDQARSPTHYKTLIPDDLNIVHVTIEVHHRSTLEHRSI